MADKRKALIDYIEHQRGKKFKLGEHDCLTFTNNAWRAMHGAGYADDLLDRYMDKGRDALREEYGVHSLQELLDARLSKCERRVPPYGALVTTSQARRWHTGVALGISVGVSAVFVGADDVIYLPIESINGAWL